MPEGARQARVIESGRAAVKEESPRTAGERESPRTAGEERESPRTAAVALAYRANQVAPRVLAKGNGLLAEAIIARAKSSGVFVHESPELVALLMQVDIDQDIPPSLYLAVAQLLAWIYRLEHSDEDHQ